MRYLILNGSYYRPQRSWGKVIFLQASVILSTGGSGPGGYLVQGVSAPGGVPGPGGCLVETPRDFTAAGQYASYWNAFLFCYCFELVFFFKRETKFPPVSFDF